MTGLIYRDLFTYYRRSSKSTWITEIIIFFAFLLVIKGQFSVFTYLFCVIPLSMSGMPTTMKEMDINYKGAVHSVLLPFSSRELVLSRYLSALLSHGEDLALMLLYCVVHYCLYRQFALTDYFLLLLVSWMFGILFTAVNLLAAYLGDLNVTAIIYMLIIAVVILGYFAMTLAGIDFTVLFTLKTPFLLLLLVAAAALVTVVCYLISLKKFSSRK